MVVGSLTGSAGDDMARFGWDRFRSAGLSHGCQNKEMIFVEMKKYNILTR